MKFKPLTTCSLILFIFGCNSPEKSSSSNIEDFSVAEFAQPADQIGEYVVATYKDSKDNLWFGTLEKGVAQFDGNRLQYFTIVDGLPSNRVVDIVEMPSGEIWPVILTSRRSKFVFLQFNAGTADCRNRSEPPAATVLHS